MSRTIRIAADRVKEVLLEHGVRPESVSPYLTAWMWAESGKAGACLSGATVRTYEADARRVYRLLGEDPPQPDTDLKDLPF